MSISLLICDSSFRRLSTNNSIAPQSGDIVPYIVSGDILNSPIEGMANFNAQQYDIFIVYVSVFFYFLEMRNQISFGQIRFDTG